VTGRVIRVEVWRQHTELRAPPRTLGIVRATLRSVCRSRFHFEPHDQVHMFASSFTHDVVTRLREQGLTVELSGLPIPAPSLFDATTAEESTG
jgi:hypothetical protein